MAEGETLGRAVWVRARVATARSNRRHQYPLLTLEERSPECRGGSRQARWGQSQRLQPSRSPAGVESLKCSARSRLVPWQRQRHPGRPPLPWQPPAPAAPPQRYRDSHHQPPPHHRGPRSGREQRSSSAVVWQAAQARRWGQPHFPPLHRPPPLPQSRAPGRAAAAPASGAAPR